MSPADLIYVIGALFATVFIPSLPGLASLRGAGPRYRVATLRFLIAGWAVAALAGMWMGVGWGALKVGGWWWSLYRDLTFVLMGAWFVLLPLGIWWGNRSARAAQQADRDAGWVPTR